MRLGRDPEDVILLVLLLPVLRITTCIPLPSVLALLFLVNFLVQKSRCSRDELLSGC